MPSGCGVRTVLHLFLRTTNLVPGKRGATAYHYMVLPNDSASDSPEQPGKFPLGVLYTTPGAQAAIPGDEMVAALRRHIAGDWGDVDEHDWEENELSLREGFRLFSVYRTKAGEKFWIITEADPSCTTVLLPEEY